MKPPRAWKVGLYSKIVLTVIAVSLVGLLVRQLPEKVEAKPEQRTRVNVLSMDYTLLRSALEMRVALNKESQLLFGSDRDFAQEVFDNPYAVYSKVLLSVLLFDYAMGFRVKFATDDFMILEAE